MMRTEDVKRNILKLVDSLQSEIHGYDLQKLLASEKIEVTLSRLYRVLNVMLKEGLLGSRWEKSQVGPRKRLYRLGEKGRKELDELFLEAIDTVHSRYGRYLQSLRPKINVFDDIFSLLTGEMKGHENIAYLTIANSTMHKLVLLNLQKKVPEGKIYFVKPPPIATDLNIEDMVILRGTHEDIPLKDDYVNLLFVIDLPNESLLETALKEWHRVLTRDGRLAILTPTILIQKHEARARDRLYT
jgi:DNA-binding PadR family transcriptional regulator